MGEMIGEVRRINKHIKELLSLGRSDDDVFSPVDIGGLIESSVRLVETRARDEGIGIELALGLEGALVFGNLNDPDSEVSRTVTERPVSRIREDWGTEPKVYYIGL